MQISMETCNTVMVMSGRFSFQKFGVLVLFIAGGYI
jgi:hypothetical protein